MNYIQETDRSNYDNNFWNEFDIAVCGFCASQCRQSAESTSLINTLIGHGKLRYSNLNSFDY